MIIFSNLLASAQLFWACYDENGSKVINASWDFASVQARWTRSSAILQRDCATLYVHWNIVKCCTTVTQIASEKIYYRDKW